MTRLAVTVVWIGLFALPAIASEPGEPLDCSDWVFLEPGLSCAPVSGILSDDSGFHRGKGQSAVVDNEGGLLTLRFTFTETYNANPFSTLGRIELIRTTGVVEEVIARIDDRLADGIRDQVRSTFFWDWRIDRGDSPPKIGMMLDPIIFDAVNGSLIIPVHTYCNMCDGAYPNQYRFFAINGFPPLLELFQTYTRTASELSFRVSAMPEGFQFADRFDTYVGDLATVGNWSQAQPHQCGYPASPPSGQRDHRSGR